MFFIMPYETIQSFWMKNTYLSLDMVFIAKNGEVVSILRNVPPLTLNPRKSTGPAKFILELGAGSAEKLGVIEGSRVVLVEDGGGFLQGYF